MGSGLASENRDPERLGIAYLGACCLSAVSPARLSGITRIIGSAIQLVKEIRWLLIQ